MDLDLNLCRFVPSHFEFVQTYLVIDHLAAANDNGVRFELGAPVLRATWRRREDKEHDAAPECFRHTTFPLSRTRLKDGIQRARPCLLPSPPRRFATACCSGH